MILDDNDGQMIFGDEEKPRKNLTQETCPDRGSNPGPLHDRCACCRLTHSGGPDDVTASSTSDITAKVGFYHNSSPLYYIKAGASLYDLASSV